MVLGKKQYALNPGNPFNEDSVIAIPIRDLLGDGYHLSPNPAEGRPPPGGGPLAFSVD